MTAYLMLLALFAVAGVILFIIYSAFEEDGPRRWALRVFVAVFLGFLLRIAMFAGSPWDIGVLSFVVFWAFVYPLVCVPDDVWSNLSEMLDQLWNKAKYARMDQEANKCEEERAARSRAEERARLIKAFENREADRARDAENAKRRQSENTRLEVIRLKNEAYEKNQSEEYERERKAAIVRDLRDNKGEEIPDF